MQFHPLSRPQLQGQVLSQSNPGDITLRLLPSFAFLLVTPPTAHAKEANFPIPKDPIMFAKPRTALAGPGEVRVAKAAQDDQLDFETELALVIGKDATDVSEANALDYVLGSVPFPHPPEFPMVQELMVELVTRNQVYVFQRCVCAQTPAQQFAVVGFFAPSLGRRRRRAYMVAQVLRQGIQRRMPDRPRPRPQRPARPRQARLQGRAIRRDRPTVKHLVSTRSEVSLTPLRDMIFGCRKAVSFLSQGTTLEKGTIILMGTPSGIGWAREPKRIIRDGEEMRIWFEGIGTLVNTFRYL